MAGSSVVKVVLMKLVLGLHYYLAMYIIILLLCNSVVLLDSPSLHSLVHCADTPCNGLLEVVPGPRTGLHH